MPMTVGKVEVGVAPFIEGDELGVDISVGDHDLAPVRVPISQLIDDYIEFNSEMFTNSIAGPNKEEARQLVGILRLSAHTLEQALA